MKTPRKRSGLANREGPCWSNLAQHINRCRNEENPLVAEPEKNRDAGAAIAFQHRCTGPRRQLRRTTISGGRGLFPVAGRKSRSNLSRLPKQKRKKEKRERPGHGETSGYPVSTALGKRFPRELAARPTSATSQTMGASGGAPGLKRAPRLHSAARRGGYEVDGAWRATARAFLERRALTRASAVKESNSPLSGLATARPAEGMQ
jgi:hypothetical protein